MPTVFFEVKKQISLFLIIAYEKAVEVLNGYALPKINEFLYSFGSPIDLSRCFAAKTWRS